MTATDFQVLDRLIEADGQGLGAKALASAGGAKKVLDSLCERKLLEKKSKNFVLTSEGRAEWEKQAPEGRRDELRRKKEAFQHQQVIAFLKKVESKKGKPLTATDLKAIPEPIRTRARETMLVEVGEKEGAFRLTAAGDAVLLGERPLAEQLQRLGQHHRESVSQWQAAQQRLADELKGLSEPAFEQAHREVARRAEEARAAFDSAIAELSAFGTLTEVGKSFKDAVERESAELRRQAQSNAQARERLEAFQREASDLRDKIANFEKDHGQRLSEIESRLAAATPVSTPAPPTPAPEPAKPTDDELWQATRKAFERLRSQAAILGGSLKVPELTDEVLRVQPRAAVSEYHEALKRWERQERIRIGVCDDRRLEARASEGIESPRGLLFYVNIR